MSNKTLREKLQLEQSSATKGILCSPFDNYKPYQKGMF